MPTELQLINGEQLANILFLLSTFLSFRSASQARQAVYEKQQSVNPSAPVPSGAASAELALSSTWIAFLAYIIFTVIAISRAQELAGRAAAGDTSVSIEPSIFIIAGFILATVGALLRIPGLQQRAAESRSTIL